MCTERSREKANERDRIVVLAIIRYLKVVNGEVRFFKDPEATVSASVPPLTPEVVAAMNEVRSLSCSSTTEPGVVP